jgi:immune inhibitor A
MCRKSFVSITAVLLLVSWVLCGFGLGADGLYQGTSVAELEEAAPAVGKLPPVAIGAMRPSGPHLVKPRDEVIERVLRRDKVIGENAPQTEVRAAIGKYVERFGRKSSSWVAPEAKERASRIELDAISPEGSVTAIQPVTATVFALAVEFGGSDTFTHSALVEDHCEDQEVTTTGPLKGLIPHPGLRDNQTVWYEPTQTAKAAFYQKLIFGYEGVGRVRSDLTDPYDGKPGINLAGYTVQDYYDHVAGAGNVTITGSVKGWVRVGHSEGYYGADNCSTGVVYGGGPVPIGQLVVDAVRKFNKLHPRFYNDTGANAFWPKYDGNHDGFVDTCWIIHAGMGQEGGGGAEGDFAIWSHSWDLRAFSKWPNGFKVYEGDPSTRDDDIYIGPYTMQPENADLGVLTEEFGHNFFGFPDLYTTDYGNSVAFWSNMSAGSWGGPIGGAVPVGMPLWFKMIAWCGTGPCNWNQPMAIKSNSSPTSRVTIGQLEDTPDGVFKGARINLPRSEVEVPNRAGTGKAACTDEGRDNLDIFLDRQLTVPAGGAGVLSFNAFWDIEEGWDYGYVLVKSGGKWQMLDDMDGIFREDSPNGTNLGHGLTGTGNQALRFDLSPYKGKNVLLRLRYRTDSAVTQPGWWVDDVKLDDTVLDDFEAAVAPRNFPGWTNSSPGWIVAPLTKHYTHYYLLEWRAKTKYDKMTQTAYVTTYSDDDEWQVERVPYNIPGALLYYRNQRYGDTYSLGPNTYDVPSIGPKYQLLVVDMNHGPMRLGDTPETYRGALGTTAGSYDAALTLQPTKAFTLGSVFGVEGGPWNFASKPMVKRFDDGLGYYSGIFTGSPCGDGYLCWNNFAGSAVIPAKSIYSTRITNFDGTPFTAYYGSIVGGLPLGSGNPSDDGVEYGVRIDLLNKSADKTKATLRLNAPPPAGSAR